jgi:hypothetical protein
MTPASGSCANGAEPLTGEFCSHCSHYHAFVFLGFFTAFVTAIPIILGAALFQF